MSVLLIVVFQPSRQACLESRSAGEITPFQKTPTQHAEEEFDLVEPRTMNGGEVKHMLVTRVTQERAALCACFQEFEVTRHATAFGHPLTGFQTPMRVEIVKHPVEAFEVRELCRDVFEILYPIPTGTCRAQIPDDLAGGDTKRC